MRTKLKEQLRKDFEPMRKSLMELNSKYENNIAVIEYVSAAIRTYDGKIKAHKQIHIVLREKEGKMIGTGERIILEG